MFRIRPLRGLGIAPAVVAYGTSLVDGVGHTLELSDRWVSKVAGGLASVMELNYGQGGTKILTTGGTLQGWAMCWNHCTRLPGANVGATTTSYRPPSQAAALFMWGVNDGGFFATDPNFQATFALVYQANVRQTRAGFCFQDTNATWSYPATGGAWVAAGFSNTYGSTRHTHVSANCTANFQTLTGWAGGALTFYVACNVTTAKTWTCTVTSAGQPTVVADTSAGNIGVANQEACIPITVQTPSGSGRTYTLSFTNVGAGGVDVLGASLESAWPPLICLVSQPYFPTTPPATWPNETTTVIDGYNASTFAISQLFTDNRVMYVDLSGINSQAAYWQDDLHFDPNGNAYVADAVLSSIRSVGGIDAGYSPGPIFVAPVDPPDWSAPHGAVTAVSTAGAPKLYSSTATTSLGVSWAGVALA